MSQEQECEGIERIKHCKGNGKGIGALVTVVQGCDECGCEAAEQTASGALKAAEEAQKAADAAEQAAQEAQNTADAAKQAAQEAQKAADAAAERAEESYEKALGYYTVDPHIQDLDSFFTAPEKRWLTHTASVNAPYQAEFPAYFETRLNSDFTSAMQIFRSEGSDAVTWIRFAAVDRTNQQSPTAAWTDWRTEVKPDSMSTVMNADGSISVQLQDDGGLGVGGRGLYVNPETLSEETLDGLLKHLRLPKWLSQNTTWYVRTDGSDANDGSEDTPDKAFRTPQAAILHVTENFNLGKYTGTVKLGPGTFPVFVSSKYNASTGSMVIQGSGDTTVVESTDAHVVNFLANTGTWTLRDIKVRLNMHRTDVVTYPCAIVGNESTTLHMHNVTSEVVTTQAGALGFGYALRSGGQVAIYPGCTLTAINTVDSSVRCTAMYCSGQFTLQGSDQTLIVNGAWSNILDCTDGAMWVRHVISKPTVGGTATGKRYNVRSLAVVNTVGGGPNYFPGSVAGTVESANFGVYK